MVGDFVAEGVKVGRGVRVGSAGGQDVVAVVRVGRIQHEARLL